MRRIYSLFLVALLGMVALTANATKVTVNVDDPERVNVQVNYSNVEGIVAGDNELEVPDYQSLTIQGKDGVYITSVVRQSTGAAVYQYSANSCTIYISSSDEGETFTVTSALADDLRDGMVRVWVDDASKAQLQLNGSYSPVSLTGGDWTEVKYIATATGSLSAETPFYISAVSYGSSLYQVKVNGEVVSPEGTAYRITPNSGDEIEIFANFPDVDVPVHFNYATEEAKGFITSVTVDGVAVENYNDEDFTVKAGQKLSFAGNTTDYNLKSLKLNGEAINFYSSYELMVAEETTIDIDAAPYGTVKAVLSIDNPENITVYKGYSYMQDIITLSAGDNELELSEKSSMIQIKPNSGCYITSISDGTDAQYPADYSGTYTITLTDGMHLTIETGAIERNQTAVVYIDNKAAAVNYFSFQRQDRTDVEIANGYNVVKFYDGDNPFGFSWYGSSFSNVYLNGEAVSPLYENSTTYQATLADGDVLKIFLAGNPETYAVKFDAAEEVAAKVSVTRDLVQAVADWTDGFSVLQGTQVSLKAAEGYGIDVKVNDETVEADTEGAYTFTVNADANVSVKASTSTGIHAAQAAGRVDVYNLQGVRVVSGATAADIDRLPAGLYVVGGKKVIKR